MSLIDLYESARALGWSLIHFLWQGTLIAVALELVLVGLRGSSAQLRYLVRCAALVLMGAAPVLTFWLVLGQDVPAIEGPAAAGALGAWSGELWPVALTVAWSIGAGLFAARLCRDYLRIRRLHSAAAGTALPRAWQARFDGLASALGTRALARVVDSAVLSAPTVIGWIKPVVLIPARVLTGLSRDQIEALMAHELAHVMRHDFIVNLLQSALEALLFYHPAVWWVSKGIRAEREYCCDDVALGVTTDRVSYARALTTLESWRGRELQIGMSTLGGSLMHRIQRLLGQQAGAPARRPLSILVSLLAVSILGATTLSHAASTQDPDKLREIRAHLDDMQARIDQLRVLLDEAEELRDENRGRSSRQRVFDVQERRDRVFDDFDVEERRDRAFDAFDVLERRDREDASDSQSHTGKLHEHLRKARESINGQQDERDSLDATHIHEQVQKALDKAGLHDLSLDSFYRLELQDLPDAGKIHAKVLKALEKANVHELHLDGLGDSRLELRGLPDADKIHAKVLKALEKAKVHELHLDGLGDSRLELRDLPDANKINTQILKALEKAGLGEGGKLFKLDRLKQIEGLHEHLQGLHNVLRLRSDGGKLKLDRLRALEELEKLQGHGETESKKSRGQVF